MELYIKGINSISPSENFDNISHIPEIKLVDEIYKHYVCIEPIYKEIINPLLLRRMSRAMKMGIASALLCLKDAKIEIVQILEGSPAGNIGLVPGDAILSIDGQKIEQIAGIQEYIDTKINNPIKITQKDGAWVLDKIVKK